MLRARQCRSLVAAQHRPGGNLGKIEGVVMRAPAGWIPQSAASVAAAACESGVGARVCGLPRTFVSCRQQANLSPRWPLVRQKGKRYKRGLRRFSTSFEAI